MLIPHCTVTVWSWGSIVSMFVRCLVISCVPSPGVANRVAFVPRPWIRYLTPWCSERPPSKSSILSGEKAVKLRLPASGFCAQYNLFGQESPCKGCTDQTLGKSLGLTFVDRDRFHSSAPPTRSISQLPIHAHR